MIKLQRKLAEKQIVRRKILQVLLVEAMLRTDDSENRTILISGGSVYGNGVGTHRKEFALEGNEYE